jgi:hypothetical protein
MTVYDVCAANDNRVSIGVQDLIAGGIQQIDGRHNLGGIQDPAEYDLGSQGWSAQKERGYEQRPECALSTHSALPISALVVL